MNFSLFLLHSEAALSEESMKSNAIMLFVTSEIYATNVDTIYSLYTKLSVSTEVFPLTFT